MTADKNKLDFYVAALEKITKAATPQEAKAIAWAALRPLPDSLRKGLE